jgi:hypothetical protein
MPEVVVQRYARAIEAEVARAQLESAGIECVVSPGGEVRVARDQKEPALAVLQPQAVTAPARRASQVCPRCSGRNVTGQGLAFWTLLGAFVVALFVCAIFVSWVTLAVLAAICTLALVCVELALKNWLCLRCGERWR